MIIEPDEVVMSINANQLPVEDTPAEARYHIEHPRNAETLSVMVDKATGVWSYEILFYDDEAQDWDGRAATAAEVKAAGFDVPAKLYSAV